MSKIPFGLRTTVAAAALLGAAIQVQAQSQPPADEKKSAWLTRQKMAVRMQLAEKDFQTAEYYERTGRAPSAYFCYEVICRRYPGTKYSDLAKLRMEAIDRDRAKPKTPGFFETARGEWERLTGQESSPDQPPAEVPPRQAAPPPTGVEPVPGGPPGS